MEPFRVRLNCLDHYQAIPTEFDPPIFESLDGNKKSQAKVPVIRAFGSTPTGQKVCAHIHGAFPYLYVEYQDSLEPDEADSYINRLHLSIDHALAVSYRRDATDSKTAFVAHISLVKGVPFYGYHVGYRFFLKIYLLNSVNIVRLSDLLRQGAIMKRAMQPFESHMQYIPQWMCDYNLYGCDYMDCAQVMFRWPVPSEEELTDPSHQWHEGTIALDQVSDESSVPRQSHCALEVDVCVHNIINRFDIGSRNIHHDFVEQHIVPDADEKLVHSMAGLWRDETRRRRRRMGITDTKSTPFPPEVLVSVSADPRNDQPGGWIHEAEFRAQVNELAKHEKRILSEETGSFETFIHPHPLETSVKTAFESVEDLHPSNFPPKRDLHFSTARSRPDGKRASHEDIEVDESRILSLHDGLPGDLPYEDGTLAVPRVSENVPSIQKKEAKKDMHGGDAEEHVELTGSQPDGHLSSQSESLDLQSMGVRAAGDFSHVDDDAFEIPADFVGDLVPSAPYQGPGKVVSEALERPKKRRRLLSDAQLQARPVVKLNGSGLNGQTHALPAPHENQLATSEDSSPVNGQPKESTSGLQEVRKDGLKDGRLTFAIVKDPQDPLTIQRLSQTSSGDTKSGKKTRNPKTPTGAVSQSLAITTLKPKTAFVKHAAPQRNRNSLKSQDVVQAFDIPAGVSISYIIEPPPQLAEFDRLERKYNISSVIHQDAHYGNEANVPERTREYAGRDFKLESTTARFLPDFNPLGEPIQVSTNVSPEDEDEDFDWTEDPFVEEPMCTLTAWEFSTPPPRVAEVEDWMRRQTAAAGKPGTRKAETSQIDTATQKNKHGFKYSQKQVSTSVRHETQYMSSMSLEVHVNTSGDLVPNPEKDEIACIFWCFNAGESGDSDELGAEGLQKGMLVLSESEGASGAIARMSSFEVLEETSELDLINRLVDIVREQDPDVLTGFEVHNGSWGYLIERARVRYEFGLCDELSRTLSQSHGRFGREADRWGFNQTSTIRVTGRHMINIWRAMRGELNLLQYTLENIAFHTLHRRVPHYSFADLTRWYQSGKPRDLARVIDYFMSRTQLDLQILEQNELVPRTSEQARLLGVDFFSVFSRGSQFKVESLMFRIAKPESLLLISPSRKQVGEQNALECLPLVMEPQSAFYASPMLVLDFQSLYPSVMIAYNYCYSTFLGRVVNWRGSNKMGFTNFAREPGLLNLLKNHINIAPNGMMYTKPHVRKSLLAKMLGEILETRVMVKSGMKVDKDDKTLQRLLNNRQLALKLIANVTYGYTSASFSGRMPCSEIADSIVQTGRETLEKAIALIHSVDFWGAEVVYGDTDSLFVHLKGRTRDEAFDIGNQIAKAITDMNPRPVKLKFEKVYHPCVLLAKKRYVGFKYESKDQKEPEFEAKGIETVRRDGTPAEQKIEERALKTLFRTADLSQVKSYFQRQCEKIMKGRVSVQDFCYAKEVKLGTYSDRGPPPPGALVSTRKMLADPRKEPQYGERVPYLVIAGAPGARLIDRVVAPEILLENDHHELDAEYYISKNIIPPLERIFNLMGANVRQWYDDMPKYHRIRHIEEAALDERELPLSKKILEAYMRSSSCVVCLEKFEGESLICAECLEQPVESLFALREQLAADEKKATSLDRTCRSCAGVPFGDGVRCDSKDCPVFYSRTRHRSQMAAKRATILPIVHNLELNEGEALDW